MELNWTSQEALCFSLKPVTVLRMPGFSEQPLSANLSVLNILRKTKDITPLISDAHLDTNDLTRPVNYLVLGFYYLTGSN